MLKKLFLIALALLLVYVVFIDHVTSRIIFSRRSLGSKLLSLTTYFLRALLRIIWQTLKSLFYLMLDSRHRLTGYQSAPAYDIRSFKELYRLYQDVADWSNLPWQIFWGIHAEETDLGRNLGSTNVLSVLPKGQISYFYQICRELQWDPQEVRGSHKGAIGPFQFIPETWVRNAVDANGDGRKDPFDVEDAAYSAANYLLRKGARTDLRKGIWHYNQDSRYVKRVMSYLRMSSSARRLSPEKSS